MTPEDLLRRYATDLDQQAFAGVVETFTPLVYGLALRRSRRADLAAEIAQDVFLACARKATALAQKGTPLGPWLHRTTLLETMNHLRKEASHQSRLRSAVGDAGEPAPYPAPEDPWIAARSQLDEVLNGLDELSRAAVLLRFYEERSFPQIGEAFGRSEEAARKLCGRALDKLARALRRRGVVVTAAALTAGLGGHFSAAAAIPGSLAAGIIAHVAASAGAPLVSGGPVGTLMAAGAFMKSTPTLLTAAALLLVALPACWQWYEIRSLRTVTAELQSSREAASRARPTPPPPGGSTNGGTASSTVDDSPSFEDISSLVERLLKLRQRSAQGSVDAASAMEIFRLQRQVKSWPAEAVREALDHLLAMSVGGSARLELVAILLEVAYSEKAPGEATRLAMRSVNQDPRFYEAARWSLAQWYLADPGAAGAWVAEQESSGSLAGTGVEDLGNTLIAQGRLLGAVMADPAGAPAAVAAADAVTAEKALRAWIGRLPENLDPSAFVRAAAAINDPSRAGKVIGSWAKSGPLPVGDAPRLAEVDRLLSRIPDDLSPEVRRAALIEGAQWGGTETSLAVLAQVADPSDRLDSLAEATRQLILDGFGPPNEAWLLSNSELRPYRDEVAAAAALALGGVAGAGGHQNPAAAAAWLKRIEDDALRASIAGRLTRP